MATKCTVHVKLAPDADAKLSGPLVALSTQSFLVSGLEKDVVQSLVWPKLVVGGAGGMVRQMAPLHVVCKAWRWDMDVTTTP